MGLIGSIRQRFLPSFTPSGQISFVAERRSFNASVLDITRSHIRKLGINPSAFHPGLKVYIMKEWDFMALNEIMGLKTSGFYTLPGTRSIKQVDRGGLEFLPKKDRIIVLPENYERRTLVHETLHDIFLGCFSKDQRDMLFKCIGVWFDKLRNAGAGPETDFFEEVSERVSREYDLEKITKKSLGNSVSQNTFSDNFKLFAGECFAYAGELILLGYDDAQYLGRVPWEMKNYFVRMELLRRPALRITR